MKNNAPRYVLIDYSKLQDNTEADDEMLEDVATRLPEKHMKALSQQPTGNSNNHSHNKSYCMQDNRCDIHKRQEGNVGGN